MKWKFSALFYMIFTFLFLQSVNAMKDEVDELRKRIETAIKKAPEELKVRIWPTDIKNGSQGHVSIETKKNYISLYPDTYDENGVFQTQPDFLAKPFPTSGKTPIVAHALAYVDRDKELKDDNSYDEHTLRLNAEIIDILWEEFILKNGEDRPPIQFKDEEADGDISWISMKQYKKLKNIKWFVGGCKSKLIELKDSEIFKLNPLLYEKFCEWYKKDDNSKNGMFSCSSLSLILLVAGGVTEMPEEGVMKKYATFFKTFSSILEKQGHKISSDLSESLGSILEFVIHPEDINNICKQYCIKKDCKACKPSGLIAWGKEKLSGFFSTFFSTNNSQKNQLTIPPKLPSLEIPQNKKRVFEVVQEENTNAEHKVQIIKKNKTIGYHQEKIKNGDFEEAFECFSKAAEKNHPLAQYELALMCLKGQGTTKDVLKALELLEAAATQKNHAVNTQASLKLGNMYLYGEGVKKSELEAIKWFTISAENGHQGAMNVLKLLLEKK